MHSPAKEGDSQRDREQASCVEEMALQALGDITGKKQLDEGRRMSTACRAGNGQECLESRQMAWLGKDL